MAIFTETKKLFSGSTLGFQSIGDPINGNTLALLCKCLPYSSGTYQWTVKTDPGLDDSSSISADNGSLSGDSLTINIPITSGFTVGTKYYFALKIDNGATPIEVIQVSFEVAQNGVDSAGTSIVQFFTSQFTQSGEPITTTNKIVDKFSYPLTKVVTVGGQGRFQGNTTATIKTAVNWVKNNWGSGTVYLIDENYTYSNGDVISNLPSGVNIIGLPYRKSKITGCPPFGTLFSSQWRNKFTSSGDMSTQTVSLTRDPLWTNNSKFTFWYESGAGSITATAGTATLVSSETVSTPGKANAKTIEISTAGTVVFTVTGTVNNAMLNIGTVARDYTEFSDLHNATYSNLVFDCQNAASGTAFKPYYPKNVRFVDCEFLNLNQDGWFAASGTDASGTLSGFKDETIAGDIEFVRCVFDTHAGDLENLLVFNIDRVLIKDCIFKNNSILAGINPVLGIWDKCNNVTIENVLFMDCSGANLYYSLRCGNIYVKNVKFINCGNNIVGANPGDYVTTADSTLTTNLVIDGLTSLGGDKSTQATAIQVGRLQNYSINNFYINKNKRGISFDGGNSANVQLSKYGAVTNGSIVDSNPLGTDKSLNAGLAFGEIGGDMYLDISNVHVYDTRPEGSRTVDYSIIFTGALTFDNIRITNCTLQRGAASTQSIFKSSSTTIGSNVKVIYPLDFTLGTFPPSNVVS